MQHVKKNIKAKIIFIEIIGTKSDKSNKGFVKRPKSTPFTKVIEKCIIFFIYLFYI